MRWKKNLLFCLIGASFAARAALSMAADFCTSLSPIENEVARYCSRNDSVHFVYAETIGADLFRFKKCKVSRPGECLVLGSRTVSELRGLPWQIHWMKELGTERLNEYVAILRSSLQAVPFNPAVTGQGEKEILSPDAGIITIPSTVSPATSY